MTTTIRERLESNPFSTRFVRPGALRYQFENRESASTIVDRWTSHGGRGAIVGPHGSGKSTLLAELTPELESRGWIAWRFALHDGQRTLPVRLQTLKRTNTNAQSHNSRSLLIIDGYEQLSGWHRWRLDWMCARLSLGLLVTSHAATSFPTLLATKTSLTLLADLVEELLPPQSRPIEPEELAAAFTDSRGNLRESLFALYDRYERNLRNAIAAGREPSG